MINRMFLAILTGFFSMTGHLALAASNGPDLTMLKTKIVGNAEIKSVKPSQVPGIFEVQINHDIVYLTADGDKVFSGEIYDLAKGINYTERARNHLRKAALAAVKDEDKIIYKAKNEEFKVTVFTDITCPYCTKLHENMATYNDKGITVEYLAFPRAGIGSKTQKDMQKIWCAEDKAIALTKAKNTNILPTETCENKQTVEQFLLGRDIGVQATPTFIFSDGTLHAGLIEPDMLQKMLRAKFSKKTPEQPKTHTTE